MALTINLGRSVFCSFGSNLNLTQHATAVITPPTGTSIPMEAQSLEEMICTGEVWLDQATEIRLQIRVVIGSDLVGPASTFFSQIGEILCHSKIWFDLGLNVLFKSCDHVESAHSETFQLSFGLRKTTKQYKTPKSLRIPNKLRSTHEAAPPDGIPTAYLSTIDISLDYKRCDQSIQRGIAGPLTVDCASKELGHILPIVEIDNDEHDDMLIEVGYLHSVEYLCPAESTIVTEKKDPSAFARELQAMEERWYPIPPFSLKSCPLLSESQCVQLDKEFHTLFDFGFRSLIARDQRRDKKAIEIHKSEDSKCLSTISPTTFSLGYREAMNQRSQFIPSIASSLASMLERSKNPALRHKRSLLKSSHHSQPDSFHTPDTSIVKTSIKQSLWRIAQKGLYKPEASRSLRPLESVSNLEEGYSALEHATLFTPPATEEANYIDEDAESYDSYLGSEMDEFESLGIQPESDQEEEQDEEQDEEERHSLLPAIEETHTNASPNMLDNASDEGEDEHMELDATDLDDMIEDQTDSYYYFSSAPTSQKFPFHNYQPPPPSDISEMLTSDSVELDMDDPNSFPTTITPISIGIDLGEMIDENNDDMLCNQV